MLTVRITDVGRQAVLDDAEYLWIKNHLDTPLLVNSIHFDNDTHEPWFFSVRTDSVCGAIITLFVDSNDIKYVFEGSFTLNNL